MRREKHSILVTSSKLRFNSSLIGTVLPTLGDKLQEKRLVAAQQGKRGKATKGQNKHHLENNSRRHFKPSNQGKYT
jgi:hypothetical protein